MIARWWLRIYNHLSCHCITNFPEAPLICGAGDHLPKLDATMRRVKETYQCIQSDLQWKIPLCLQDNVVKYYVSRLHARRTKALNTKICPRVRMTGRKINYQKEFGLAFGNYVEDKTRQGRTNTMEDRSEPCIGL